MKKFSSSQKLLEGACLAVLAGMIFLPILFWKFLPEQIPCHYNFAGEIDNWDNKGMLFLLPVSGGFLYLLLTFASVVLREFAQKGEAPQTACLWLAGVKLTFLVAFALTEWHSALSRPMAAWFSLAEVVLYGVLMAGFLISCVSFAVRLRTTERGRGEV